MTFVTGLECLRCDCRYPPGPLFVGCPNCQGTQRSNLQIVYDRPDDRPS